MDAHTPVATPKSTAAADHSPLTHTPLFYPPLFHQKYRPDIDGLRAIAALSVVLYHAFPDKLPGGFVGVDIFFVISGYLISTILFTSLEQQRLSLVEFYVRRIRRIFPALITVMLFTLAAGWWLLVGEEFTQLGKHTSGGAGFISNFLFWNESGYFDTEAEAKPLLHLWSLAIEEQFYIIWPVLLMLVWRLRWNLLWTAAAAAILSMALNVAITQQDTVAGFYSPLTRFWELLLGAVLAALHLRGMTSAPRLSHLCSLVGAGCLLAALALLNQQRTFPGWWALLPTLGTVLLIAAGPQGVVNRRLLMAKPMVAIGLISYPLYLWHWPLLVYVGLVEHDPPNGLRALVVLSAMLLAWLTYRFIEKPLRFSRNARSASLGLLATMLCLLFVGLAVNNGLLTPRHTSPELKPILDAVDDWHYPTGLDPVDSSVEGVFQARSESTAITLFLGDSHVQQYGPDIARIVEHNRERATTAMLVTSGGCPPIPDVFDDRAKDKDCEQSRAYGLELIATPSVSAVVIGGCWNCYFIAETKPRTPDSKNDFYALDNGRKMFFRDGEGVALAQAKLEALLRDIAAHKPVYLMLDNPIGADYAPQNLFEGSRITGLAPRGDGRQRVALDADEVRLHQQLMALAQRSGAKVLDPRQHLCNDDGCLRMARDGRPLYSDSDHLRPFAVREYAHFLDAVLIQNQP